MTGAAAGARRVVVVLGMHRGGTSLAARAVAALGIGFGDNLWGPKPDNPTGFWEDRDVVDLNSRLLQRRTLDWSSLELAAVCGAHPDAPQEQQSARALIEARLARYGTWGVKDPRMARLLPFWKEAFRAAGAEPTYVVTARHPSDVSASLQRRDGMPALHSRLLWLEHMCCALEETRGARRCFVDYDELVDGPAAALERLARRLGVGITGEAAAGIAEFAREFVAQGLRHHRTREEDAFDPATHLYGLLRQAAGDQGETAALEAEARSTAASLQEWQSLREFWVGQLRSQLDRLDEDKRAAERITREHGALLQQFNAEIERLRGSEAELSRIKKHWYWRIARLIIR